MTQSPQPAPAPALPAASSLPGRPRWPVWLLLAAGLAMLPAACAPAPLYSGNRLPKGAVVGGDVPRNAQGEPVWSAIRPIPEGAIIPPRPGLTRLPLPTPPAAPAPAG